MMDFEGTYEWNTTLVGDLGVGGTVPTYVLYASNT